MLIGPGTSGVMKKEQLGELIRLLRAEGYSVIGPRMDQGAVVYGELESDDDLPIGYHDTQGPGTYQSSAAEDGSYFEYNLGPHSWKKFLFPPHSVLSRATYQDGQWSFQSDVGPQPKLALLGVRACELEAIRIQDRIFLEGQFVDSLYQQRREQALLIAVNCTTAANTCFCTSTEPTEVSQGPKCMAAFDLCLTELPDEFLVEVGSERGATVAQGLQLRPAEARDRQQAAERQERAVEQISRHWESAGVVELLLENLEHPHWDDVAERCLSCTNCTMVCPTCFCASVSEVSDLASENVDRVRQWDSCFNMEFTHTAGGVVRGDRRSRYRQWLTHKLATWHQQFGSSGCVGCGRCITWCPVGIDLTEEVDAIRASTGGRRQIPVSKPPEPAVCMLPSAAEFKMEEGRGGTNDGKNLAADQGDGS